MIVMYVASQDNRVAVVLYIANIEDLRMKEEIKMPNEAEWIYGEEEHGQDGWTCSKCNLFVPWYYKYYKSSDFIAEYNFCPKCGAKMVSYTGKVFK